MTATTQTVLIVPLRDRVAALLVIPALAPYLLALCAAWWFLRHGDDGFKFVEVGSWPMALMISVFLWVAFASALSTAWQLLARPTVYWHQALPFALARMHLVASGLVSVLAVIVLTGWMPLLGLAAGSLLPAACILAFSAAVSPNQWTPLPEPEKASIRLRAAALVFIAAGILAIAALEISRTADNERLTIALYAMLSFLGLPWSALLFPFAFVIGGLAGNSGPVVFDASAILGFAINAIVATRLATSSRFQSRALSRFFRLG